MKKDETDDCQFFLDMCNEFCDEGALTDLDKEGAGLRGAVKPVVGHIDYHIPGKDAAVASTPVMAEV